MTREFTGDGERLDVTLSRDGELSRSRAAALIKEGRVTVNGRTEDKPSFKAEIGARIVLDLPDIKPAKAEAQDIPLEILYQDAHLAVVVKPCGMVVHPAAGNDDGTLVNALLYHLDSLSGIGGEMRPGIVHRLDKDTSGIMIVAKNDEAHVSLSKQIQDKTARRTYLCIVRGNVKADRGLIETRMDRDKNDRKRMAVVTEGGREAVTEYEVLDRFGRFTVVRCSLKTGRPHQIRLHMEYLGYPLVGDPKYSPMKTPFSIKGQALHSQTLDFIHPRTGKPMHFEAPLPEDMQKIMTRLHNGQF